MRLAIIPARGGSKRLPRKNVKPFFGKPIIAYSIECAQQSGLFTDVVVSTDDSEIAAVATQHGANVSMRGPGWDELGTQEVAKRVLEMFTVPPKIACVIYATVPMLKTGDLHRGISNLYGDFAFSVGTDPLRDAGMFYFGRAEAFLRGLPLISEHSTMVPMPENRIADINLQADWDRAEKMYAKMHGIWVPA